jgi:hypothetical protein
VTTMVGISLNGLSIGGSKAATLAVSTAVS